MAHSRICSIPDYGNAHENPACSGDAQRFLKERVLSYDGEDCLTWPFARFGNGYPSLRYQGRNVSVHRLVCEIVHGAPPSAAHQAAHSCGNGLQGCVNPWHLSWKTPSANNLDKIEHGTMLRGERHHSAKLTQKQVKEIRKLRGTMTQAEIGHIYGVSAVHISRIFRGKKWGWLT